jgi:hypothetical protein
MTIKREEYDRFITETLVATAEGHVNRLVRRGKSLQEAKDEVILDMHLTDEEADLLHQRTKKAPVVKKVEVDETLPDHISSSRSESIYFSNKDDSDSAIQILMSKNIPWKQRGEEDGQHYVQFETPEEMDKAHEAMKRRWDFVDQQPRKVAVIEFDNLADYEKVLDFISRQGSLVDFNEPHDLEEDADLHADKIARHATEARRAIKDGLEPPPAPAPLSRSYLARSKDARADFSEIDPKTDASKRVVRIRRRWK